MRFTQTLLSFVLLFCCVQAHAQLFQLNGDAIDIGAGCYQLTESLPSEAGSVWRLEQINLTQDFRVEVGMNLGCQDANGADGMVFAFQPLSSSVGTLGGGMGILGIEPSLAVEFDTYQNGIYNDPFYDHIAILRDGNIDHDDNLDGPVTILNGENNAEDCSFHSVIIDWQASTQTLEVYVDCDLRVSYSGDVIDDIFDGDPMVYWGLTSATGALFNAHQFCFEAITESPLEDATICAGDSYSVALDDGAGDYTWEPTDGVSDPSASDPTFFPTETTTYVVSVEGICDFVTTDTFTLTVLPEPSLYLVSGPTCIETTTDAEVTIGVNGPSATYTLSGDLSTNLEAGGEMLFTLTGDGSSVNVIATADDELGCSTTFSFDMPVCIACAPDPGVMSEEVQIVCADGEVSAQTSGEIVEDGQNVYYAMHTSATAVPGSILGLNETGIFSLDDLSGATYNTEYYISPIVAFPAADGGPDLADDCTVIAAGTPVVFLAPIEIDAGDNCDNETGFFQVVFSITGGLPAYDNSFSYSVTGDFLGELDFGDSELIGPFMGGTGYILNVTDDLGCEDAINVAAVPCLKVPIELLQFEGTAETNGNLLTWTTATEINNNYFTLERSLNGTAFTPIAQIDGAGNSEHDITYSYLDETALCGISYYRLSWTDYDGFVEYAPVISVQRDGTNAQAVQVIPSVVQSDVTVFFSSNGNSSISVLDVTGKQLSLQAHTTNDCQAKVNLNVQHLPRGVYFIQVEEGAVRTVVKFVKL